MFVRLGELVDEVRAVTAGIDVACVDGSGARRLVELADELRRAAEVLRTRAVGRVEATAAWKQTGAKSCAQWLASTTGTTVGEAIGTVDLAVLLPALPATETALAAGRISTTQAVHVAKGAIADPSAEVRLLRVASTASVRGLADESRRVIAAAVADERDRYTRIWRSRYLRTWTDPDGAFRLDARLTPDDGAKVMVAIEPLRDQLFHDARRAGRRETTDQYGADALVALADRALELAPACNCDAVDGDPSDATPTRGPNAPTRAGDASDAAAKPARRARGSTRPPRAVINVRVDHAALVRGHTQAGETCEIDGIGTIPVATVNRMLGDAILKVLVTKGTDITTVVHAGRTIPARLRTALEQRDPKCVVPDCDERHHLEIDHVIPFAQGGPTSIENLVRLCRFHHMQKTHHGAALVRGPSGWEWVRPEDAGRRPVRESEAFESEPLQLLDTG